MDYHLERIAATQDGLFTSAQAMAAGYSLQAQARKVRQARWHRVFTGVYVEQVAPPRLDQRCRAIMLACGDGVAICGRAALRLRGVEAADPVGDLGVLISPGASFQQRHGVRYRRGIADTYEWRKIRCVTPAEAAVEVARFERASVSVPIIDEVLRRGLASIDQIERLVCDLPKGSRGCRCAADAAMRADGLAESRPESLFRLIVQGSDLPPLVPQFRVYDEHGVFVANVDFAYPWARLAIEYDGAATHRDNPHVFREDRRRQNRLVAAGWTVLRFTAADLREPDRIVATIRAALR